MFIAASTTPSPSRMRRCDQVIALINRQGRRQQAKTTAAAAMRSQATPSTSIWANNNTASEGPR